MATHSTRFTNEDGNWITMTVSATEATVTVVAVGPTSLVEHTWTRDEADELATLIRLVMRRSEVAASPSDQVAP